MVLTHKVPAGNNLLTSRRWWGDVEEGMLTFIGDGVEADYYIFFAASVGFILAVYSYAVRILF